MENYEEIILKDQTQKVLTLEEFRMAILNDNSLKLADILADKYENLPTVLKILKNFDPTGISSCIDDILSQNKANREQARLIDAIYYLYLHFTKLTNTIKSAIDRTPHEFSLLTETYFQKSKECFQLGKIRYFANVWFHSISNTAIPFDEKEYIFEVVSSISFEQINILKFIYDKVEGVFINSIKTIDFENAKPIGIKEYSDKNNLDYSYVQQLCLNLYGKGLLNVGAGTFTLFQPHHFFPTSFVCSMINYLKDHT